MGMAMKNVTRKLIGNKILWLLVLLLTVCLVYLNQFGLVLKDAVLTGPDGQTKKIIMPHLEDMDNIEYGISGKVYYNRLFSAGMAHIVPDDEMVSIRVNGRDVPLESLDKGRLNDYHQGFHFNLGRYMRNGENQLEFRIRNTGGPSGLKFQDSRYDMKMIITYGLLLILFLAIIYIILSGFGVNKTFLIILLGGILVRLVYFLVTPYTLREHDSDAHLEYIYYVLNHWSIPPKNYGWETYQPPLYYILNALLFKGANLLGINSPYLLHRLGQVFSLILSVGFLATSLIIFKRIASEHQSKDQSGTTPGTAELKRYQDRFVAVGFGLIAFWPSAVMHSTRLGNDMMFYFLYALGLLYLIKWYFDNTARSLYTAFILTTLCFITKSNALILYGVFGIIFLFKFLKERKFKKYLVRAAILLIIFSAGFWVTFGQSVVEKMNGSKDNFMVSGAWGLKGLEVGNEPKNYLWFDFSIFATQPFADPWHDEAGRQYYWNHLFRTGLTGEYDFGSPFHRTVSLLLGFLFLGMLGFLIVSLPWMLWKEWNKHLILGLSLFFLLAASILIRISMPFACMNDFRYILPLLISFCFFYGNSLAVWRRKGWIPLEYAGLILAVLFMAASGLFIIGLPFY